MGKRLLPVVSHLQRPDRTVSARLHSLCTKSQLAVAAVTAMPIQPAGVIPGLGSVGVDDDRRADRTETATESESRRDDRAVGHRCATLAWPLRPIRPVCSRPEPGVTILDSTAPWNDIPAGGQGTNTDGAAVQVAANVTDGDSASLHAHDDRRHRPATVMPSALHRRCAVARALSTPRDRRSTTGNGNGVPDPGEVILFPSPSPTEAGRSAETSPRWSCSSGSAHLTVLDGYGRGAALISSGSNGDLAPSYRAPGVAARH